MSRYSHDTRIYKVSTFSHLLLSDLFLRSNVTTEEKKTLAWIITVLSADKGRCAVMLNTADYHTKVTDLLSDNNTYETLRRGPTSRYKTKVIENLQNLEKDKAINRPLYYRLYPRKAIPCIYGP